MTTNYEQKQIDKAERYQDRAKTSAAKSNATLAQVREERDMIPLGQPILVGHHSEGRHRRHLASMNSRERRGWEDKGKADHYEAKAERILDNLDNDKVISSDDPDAIVKLERKVERLEGERTKFKAYNKKARAEKSEQLPKYVLANLAGNIRSVKQRILRLQAKKQIDTSDEERDGIRIEKDAEENRIRLHFPGKPPAEVRSLLKSNGFRFSGRNVAWQRHLNNAGIYSAERVIGQITDLQEG